MTTKKIIALGLAVMMAAAALTGCGGNSEPENTETVDISKVDGIELNSDTDAEASHVTIGNADITIGGARVVEQNGVDVAIVEFALTNNGDADISFTGVARADAYQNDHILTPTVADDSVDGVDMLALSENIGKGHTISVQKAYRLHNREDILEVDVTEAILGSSEPVYAVKYYSFPE